MANYSLKNKQYDQSTSMLNGFDIDMGEQAKLIHIDLTNYHPDGKTTDEIKQTREYLYQIYQSAVDIETRQKESTFKAIANGFPGGITWLAPKQELQQSSCTDTLVMRGAPIKLTLSPAYYGDALLVLHDRRTGSQNKAGQLQPLEVSLPMHVTEHASGTSTLSNEHILDKGSEIGQIAQRYFSWPNWDQSLGKPPLIAVSNNADLSYIAALKKELAGTVEMSKIRTANALKEQLANLSGVNINIEPKFGLPEVDANQFQHDPILKYDPKAWARYPVDGAMPKARSLAEKREAPLRYENTEYAIAAPKQLLINALGQFQLHHLARVNAVLATDAKSYDGMPDDIAGDRYGDYIAQSGRFSGKAKLPAEIIKNFENPAMQSAFPENRPRDRARADEIRLLELDESGIPKVGESDKAALDFALKVHKFGSSKLMTHSDSQSRITDLPGNEKLSLLGQFIQSLPTRQQLYVAEKLGNVAQVNGIDLVKTQFSDPAERDMSA